MTSAWESYTSQMGYVVMTTTGRILVGHLRLGAFPTAGGIQPVLFTDEKGYRVQPPASRIEQEALARLKVDPRAIEAAKAHVPDRYTNRRLIDPAGDDVMVTGSMVMIQRDHYEVARMVASWDDAVVTDGVPRWKSNGAVPNLDMLDVWVLHGGFGHLFDYQKAKAARDADMDAFIRERKAADAREAATPPQQIKVYHLSWPISRSLVKSTDPHEEDRTALRVGFSDEAGRVAAAKRMLEANQYQHVATLRCRVSEAFRLTQNGVDVETWTITTNRAVRPVGGPHRSTSVGDLLELEDGSRLLISSLGFTRVE